jgi:hypothetical protein
MQRLPISTEQAADNLILEFAGLALFANGVLDCFQQPKKIVWFGKRGNHLFFRYMDL